MKSGEEVYSMVKQQIDNRCEHYCQKQVQDNTYQKQVAKLCEGKVVIHADYSGNFKNKQQNEIKAGYYGRGQFSLFTVIVCIKEGNVGCKNYALVTPKNDHCNISFGLSNFMISKVCSYFTIHTVKFWSDGYASQFYSWYAFYMLSKFDATINLQLNYFEANHRKGAVDETGGTVEHAVYSHVLTTRAVIKSLREFSDYANSILPCITVQYIDNDSMELRHHDECREKTIYIPGSLC